MEHLEFNTWIVAVSLIKLITVAFGLTFVFYSVRAWLKHRSRAMLLLSIGIAVLTAGLLVEGFSFLILGATIEIAHLIEAGFALVGFVFLTASIITVRTHRVRRRVAAGDDEPDGASGADP